MNSIDVIKALRIGLQEALDLLEFLKKNESHTVNPLMTHKIEQLQQLLNISAFHNGHPLAEEVEGGPIQ